MAHALLEWYANGEPATALRVFRYATAKHPAALLASDFVLCFAECLVALGRPRDARSLYERSLAAVATAVAEYYVSNARLPRHPACLPACLSFCSSFSKGMILSQPTKSFIHRFLRGACLFPIFPSSLTDPIILE